MKYTKQIFHFFKLTALMIASIATLWACDKVNVNPADLSSSVTAEFSATPDTVNKGDGAKLTWSIDDPNGKVKNVRLSGGTLGTNVNLSSSEMVYPEVSTRYFIEVTNEKGESLKSLSLTVHVLDENGLEINGDTTGEEATVVEICDDTIDNDNDGAVDCGDVDDCFEAEACAPPVEEAQASFTVEPSFTSEGDKLCPGDTVAVTWESTFESVYVVLNGGESSGCTGYFRGASAQTGSCTMVLSAHDVTLHFTGYDDVGETTFELPIPSSGEEACANPEFNGSLIVKGYPASSNLIAGEAYNLEWISKNLSSLKLNGREVAVNKTAEEALPSFLSSMAETQTFTFTLADNNQQPISVIRPSDSMVANTFTSLASTEGDAITQVIEEDGGQTLYLVSTSKVRKASGDMTTLETVVDASSILKAEDARYDKIVGYATTTAGTTYVATRNYIFKVDGETLTQIAGIDGYANNVGDKIQFLYGASDGSLLIGTNKGLAKIINDKAQCKVRDQSGDYCLLRVGLDGTVIEGTSKSDTSWMKRDSVDIESLYKKFDSKNAVLAIYMITDKGVYSSTNGGVSFSEVQLTGATSVQGFSWPKTGGGYAWNNSSIYVANRQGVYSEITGLTAEMSGGVIHYVMSHGGRLFVATANGVYVQNSVGWSEAPVFGEVVKFLTFKGKGQGRLASSMSEGVAQSMSKVMGGRDTHYVAYAVGQAGTVSGVEYQAATQSKQIFNATLGY